MPATSNSRDTSYNRDASPATAGTILKVDARNSMGTGNIRECQQQQGRLEKVGTQEIVLAATKSGNASNSRDYCKSRDARNSMGTSNIRECQQQQGRLQK
jgi:hypothetical protein